MDTARPSRRKKTATSVPEDAPYAQDESPLPSASFSQSSSTIRPVTPESNPDIDQSFSHAPDDHLQADFSTATSPATSPKTLAHDGSNHMHRSLVSRNAATANDGEYAMRSSREPGSRPRTRTMEERTSRDRSPSSLFKSRHRIGSVHSTGPVPFQGLDDTVTSIGHPSTISPPPVNSSRNNSGSRARLMKQPPRTTSPLPHSHSAQPDSWVSPVPASDAKKILRLMRSTCGRMKGMLAFRRGDTSPWALSYCYINEESGSLVYEPKNDNSYHRTLIPDLRGCRVKTAYDAESYTAYIDINLHNSNLEVHLRPPTQEEYDSWFAALMCWQPIRPKGIQNKMAKPQQPLSSASGRPPLDSRRHSEISLLKEAPIIKVGKMIFWDTNVSYSNAGNPKWRRVSCTLRENGELKLYSDTDVTLVSVVQLSQLSRYMFRMERSLNVRIIEARLCPPLSPKFGEGRAIHHGPRPSSGNKELQGGYYVEVLLDGETRARTMIKDAGDPFWREEFDFQDLPAAMSTASLLLKKRPTTPPSNGAKAQIYAKDLAREAFAGNDSSGGYSGISFDQTCGKVDVYLDDLESGQEVEKWWPMINMYGNCVGELLVRVKAEEGVILMARDYQPMSELLHRFSNGLTLQIATMIPQELKRLSECLLNIFQVSGQAGEWIMALVEEEIDGTAKETSVSRLRFSRRLGSGDAGDLTYSNAGDRELVVRDLGNNAKLEANLLFRGNTLLTKALDFHMKRLGKEYLEETLGERLQEIADRDPECEVDPNRIGDPHEVQRNWKRLIALTEKMWDAIASSVHRCPAELRLIFRHIRACAEDRYGDFLRTVTYSSVSGFIFLRFFCPAVLNPKLFGLLKDHPKMRARRTLTLIAKSLQGLANMSTFGAKEQWMEPMNSFLNGHRHEFKKFIDDICSISPNTSSVSPIPPSYSTPLAILQRLPPTSREGFPSLPYLIDHARNFAELVTLWLDNTGELAENLAQEEGDLAKFHNICVALNARTQGYAQPDRSIVPCPFSSFYKQYAAFVEPICA
ncbi:putative gtpase activating protein [Diplodia seriata]|uniref:Putative gtpase activating protein n=1 Tax=Diplodia seriata TaxID=420778 RepID=A0A0G2G365_9PEZI|nr:putative gtpase activating protein [Diplodia seriata]